MSEKYKVGNYPDDARCCHERRNLLTNVSQTIYSGKKGYDLIPRRVFYTVFGKKTPTYIFLHNSQKK